MATFCLLHGKWHDPACWDPVAIRLEARGHAALAPDVPFDDPATGYEQRAERAVAALREAPGPSVVVGHSLGAGIAPLVAAGAGSSAIVYLCPAPTGPFAGVDVGAVPTRPRFPFPPDREDGTSVWETEPAIAAMYPRLDPDTARRLASRLRPGSSASGPYPLDQHPDIPAYLVLATEDEFFEPEWSRRVAGEVLGTEAIELATGHFPMAEAPEQLAALLVGRLPEA